MSKHSDNDNLRNDIYENLPCQAMYNDSVRKMQQQKSAQATGLGITTNATNNITTNVLSHHLLLNNISNQNSHSVNMNSSNSNTQTNSNNSNITNSNSTPSQHKSSTHNKHCAAAGNNMSKEMLYATPLRKSDRHKSGDRSPRYNQSNHQDVNNEGKLSNLLNNRDTNRRNGNNTQITDLDDDSAMDGCSSSAMVGVGVASSVGNSSLPSGSNHHQMEDHRILNFLKDTTQLQKKLEMSGSAANRDCPSASFSNLAREEHFANLVQQNFPLESAKTEGDELHHCAASADALADDCLEGTADNLEIMMKKKNSPDKEVNGVMLNGLGELKEMRISSIGRRNGYTVYIHREWVLKKIALCLEQRTAGKKNMPAGLLAAGKNEASGFLSARAKAAAAAASSNSSYNGCLVLGSNGSGKTSICQAIMNGNSGTKGILNRKLLASYLIESQNPECHSLSQFIRKIVLQLLSHSSLIHSDKQNDMKLIEDSLNYLQSEAKAQESKLDEALSNIELNDNMEDMLIEELKRDANENHDFQHRRSSHSSNKGALMRQKSEPAAEMQCNVITPTTAEHSKKNNYGTHPPPGTRKNSKDSKEMANADRSEKESVKQEENEKDKDSPPSSSKCSPGKKSKIPVKLGRSPPIASSPMKSSKSPATSNLNSNINAQNNIIQQGGGEADIAEFIGEDLKSEIEAAIKDEKEDENTESKADEINEKQNNEDKPEAEKDLEALTPQNLMDLNESGLNAAFKVEKENYTSPSNRVNTNCNTLPPPLPKPKSCRTIIADAYYEMLLSNPDIFECLNVDNIEKNPDECFKKALLFPLLELTPPKTALLLLIDSIDENYINEGNLISTLKGGRSGTATAHKSRNVAELLSNHIHLFPKWLFLVCTTKKQTKQITKMFTGFKKITLDDLRKSHVVKDVQEYIINRLNSDFKDSIMLTKEIIESLHQLYIKSNGCILYLEKVLNGIKENFFSFREIKLIPCTLNGLYLYICQKSFNKKQYMKIRPVLNILLASSGYVDKLFLFNCLRTHNYTIDSEEFEKRLQLMKNILAYDADQKRLKIFHNSFSDWLVDVKFATKKFICDVNEGHIMISMYYLLVADTLCANSVRKFVYHLLKSGEYLSNRNINLDMILMLLESRLNLNECFYTNQLNCCSYCEQDFKNDPNFLPKTKAMIEKFLHNELSEEFSQFLCDFFKPSLPTDAKILKLLIETGINNADAQVSYEQYL